MAAWAAAKTSPDSVPASPQSVPHPSAGFQLLILHLSTGLLPTHCHLHPRVAAHFPLRQLSLADTSKLTCPDLLSFLGLLLTLTLMLGSLAGLHIVQLLASNPLHGLLLPVAILTDLLLVFDAGKLMFADTSVEYSWDNFRQWCMSNLSVHNHEKHALA